MLNQKESRTRPCGNADEILSQMHVVTYDREFRKLNQAKTRNFKINVIKVLKTAESVAIDSIHLKACHVNK